METKEKEGLFCTYPVGDFHKPDDCVWSNVHDRHILKSEARQTVDDDWVHEDEDDWVLCYDVDLYAHVDDAWYTRDGVLGSSAALPSSPSLDL